MTKVESILVGIALGILSPLMLGVLFWWSAATISFYNVFPVPEIIIAISAFTGLGVGIFLDVLYVRKRVPLFYTVNLTLMTLVFLFCSAIMTAFCMGLPCGNIALGVLGGVYIGRRSLHTQTGADVFPRLTTWGSIFTGTVTGIWTVAMGLFALDEPAVMRLSMQLLGKTGETLAGNRGVVVVISAGVFLMILQYWCTKAASLISFRPGGAQPT